MKIKKTREIKIFLNLKKVNVKNLKKVLTFGSDFGHLKIRSLSNLEFIQTLSICLEFSPFLATLFLAEFADFVSSMIVVSSSFELLRGHPGLGMGWGVYSHQCCRKWGFISTVGILTGSLGGDHFSQVGIEIFKNCWRFLKKVGNFCKMLGFFSKFFGFFEKGGEI